MAAHTNLTKLMECSINTTNHNNYYKQNVTHKRQTHDYHKCMPSVGFADKLQEDVYRRQTTTIKV